MQFEYLNSDDYHSDEWCIPQILLSKSQQQQLRDIKNTVPGADWRIKLRTVDSDNPQYPQIKQRTYNLNTLCAEEFVTANTPYLATWLHISRLEDLYTCIDDMKLTYSDYAVVSSRLTRRPTPKPLPFYYYMALLTATRDSAVEFTLRYGDIQWENTLIL